MSNKRPSLLVMAGGTGGHIFPGLAVADYLSEQGWKIHWLGTADRMEAQLVPAQGYDISFIKIAGVRNKGWLTRLAMPFKLIMAAWQAMQVIRQVQPDVVLGMGGYASAPGGVAAWLLRKPLILHEQNAVAGMSNRYLSRIATKVLAAFPQAFGNKVSELVVGNPLRSNIIQVSSNQQEAVSYKKILVVGGSLGAKVLNDVVPEALAQLSELDVQVWHQTGKNNHQQVEQSYQQNNIAAERVKVAEFIDDMAAAYQWADLVICRAGALTVSELAMAAKPAIFVPLPHAVDDHQTKNAMYLVERNAARLLPQAQLTAKSLSQLLADLFTSNVVVQSMAEAAQQAARADATASVAQVCMEQI